jgi:hypothetical protein
MSYFQGSAHSFATVADLPAKLAEASNLLHSCKSCGFKNQ